MPDLLSYKRAFKFGWINFRRSRESSWIAVMVIAVVVFLITLLFLIGGLSKAVVNQIKEQVSIAAYFQRDIDSADMMTVKEDIEIKFSDDIQEIKIVSAEEALSHFMDRYRGDILYQRALDQVGDNPFLSSLDIIVNEPERYAEIADYLSEEYPDLLNKVDFYHRESVIDKVFETTNKIHSFGAIVALLLTLLVVLVAFSTIRISVHASRYEVETMKLVGASPWFIRTPFIIQGMISGLIAALLIAAISIPLVYFLSPQLMNLVPGFSLWNYLMKNLFWLMGLQLLTGLFLGWLSTLLAVYRHLKI